MLIRARNDVTYCGDDGARRRPLWDLPPAEIQDTATIDEEWVPAITAAGLAIITRDRHIETRTAQKDIVLSCGARMFAITTDETRTDEAGKVVHIPLDNWAMVEVVATQWRAMEKAAEEPGPYIYSLTRTSLRKIHLMPAGVKQPRRRVLSAPDV